MKILRKVRQWLAHASYQLQENGRGKRFGRRAMAGVLLGCAFATPRAEAQDGRGDAWQFEATPYVWGAGLDGTLKIVGRPQSGVEVQQDFSDLWRVLDFAAMGAFEARKGKWGALFDGVYFKVSDEGSVTGPRGFVSLSADATVTQQMYSLMATYRASEGPSVIDIVGGLRYSYVKWDVQISASVPVLPVVQRRFVETNDWIDPVVGARIQHQIADRWTLVGYADIGGFGVNSDFTWQLLAGVNYAFTSNIIGKLGYRYLSVDYDKREFTYDMSTSGFYVGLGFRW